jgi:hypothetical protein
MTGRGLDLTAVAILAANAILFMAADRYPRWLFGTVCLLTAVYWLVRWLAEERRMRAQEPRSGRGVS